MNKIKFLLGTLLCAFLLIGGFAFRATGVKPSITKEPANIVGTVNSTVNLGVGVTGTTPLSCQWYLQSYLQMAQSSSFTHLVVTNQYYPIVGATSTNLSIPLTISNVGNYFAVISNAYGSVTTSVVSVTVASKAFVPTITVDLSWNYTGTNLLDHFGLFGSPVITGPFTLIGDMGTNTSTNFVYQKTNAESMPPTMFYYVNAYVDSGGVNARTLAWDNTNSDAAEVAGYFLTISSVGFMTNLDVGTNTQVTITNLNASDTYNWYVQSYDVQRFEGPKSTNGPTFAATTVTVAQQVPATIKVTE